MTDDVELVYLHSEKYSQHLERGLNINDPALSIKWPLNIGDVSEKDVKNAFIADGYRGISL
jgi:dTDP-4-dehydrorhamnose 3,5-epimerase